MLYIDDANISFTFENLNIKILKVSRGFFSAPFPKHLHGKNLYELHLVSGGKGTLITDEGEFPLSENVLYMTGPYITHEQLASPIDPTEEFCMQIEISEIKRAPYSPDGALLKDTFFWIGTDRFNTMRYFEMLEHECDIKAPGYIQSVKSISTLILVALIRNYSGTGATAEYEKNTPDYRRMSIVESSFFDDYISLTLPELSLRLKLSTRQTQRFLKKNYDKTFVQMKADARANKAKELIRRGRTISDAARAVGYDDVRSLKRRLNTECKMQKKQ